MNVLVASDSAYRRNQYVEELGHNGIDATAVAGGVDCIERMRSEPPDAIVLETEFHWGGCEGVLAVRSEEPLLERIPVLLIAADGISSDVYCLAPFVVQGFFGRVPSTRALVTSLRLVCSSKLAAREHHDA